MNSLRIILLALLIGFTTIHCSDKKEDPIPTEDKIDLNKLHGGSKKRWYWKELDGNYERPAETGAYHDFTANMEVYNQASAEKVVYYWEYHALKNDSTETGELYKKDVKNWFGFYKKSVQGNQTTKDYSVNRFEIIKLTDTRFEIKNLLGDGLTRVYETTK